MPAFSSRDEELVYLARKLKYVREVPENKGQRVSAFQHWVGIPDGSSWCAAFVTTLLDIVYEGKSPLPRTGSCDVLLETARTNGWLRESPSVGDLYLVLRSPTDAHHTGIVVAGNAGLFTEISGNTNDDGSDNGVGVFERLRQYVPGTIVFINYPRG